MAAKPKLSLLRGAKRMRCVTPHCGSGNVRAFYQHVHREGVVTFEMPAYARKGKKVPVKGACPCGEKNVPAILVICSKCGGTGRVRGHRVLPPR
jgi:hypothetical protein